jgi:hypothetical protein
MNKPPFSGNPTVFGSKEPYLFSRSNLVKQPQVFINEHSPPSALMALFAIGKDS